MSDGTFSFGQNDDHIGFKTKAWKAQGGNTYRLSFAWWSQNEAGEPDLGEADSGQAPLFSGGPVNFIQGAGYVMNRGPEYTKMAGEPPRQRIVTVVIVWPTDKRGALSPERLQAGEYEVKPWVISADKYKTLEQIHAEFGFGEHDVTAKCEEGGTQFQKMTFTPCKENLYRQFLTSPKGAKVAGEIKDAVEGLVANVQDFIGREMTISQLREKLQGAGGAPAPLDVGDNAVASGDIESVVSGLLDE